MNFEEKLLELLKHYAGDGLYVGDDIPPKKLRHASDNFPIQADAKVYGLLDCTVFGSCKNGLAFCSAGLRWRNDWTTPSARTSMSWEELKDARLTTEKHKLNFDETSALDMAGATFKPERLADLLVELQALGAPSAKQEEKASPWAASAGESARKGSVWFFQARGGSQVVGPIIGEALVARLVEARADPNECQLWAEGAYRWRPLRDFPDLKGELLAYCPLPDTPPPPMG